MMFIHTCVRPSAIHGMGLFAVEFVPHGTPVWRFKAGFDQTFSEAEINAMPEPARRHLRWFAFQDGDQWVISGDHACFMNHASPPNTGALSTETPVVTVALRDIEAGEELTCDYLAFDADAKRKLGDKTVPPVTG